MSSIQRFGFTPVYTSPEAAVDIIFLHGLHGSPSRTWRANPTNSEGTKGGTFWPIDFLPKSLAGAPANIILYGYNADIISTASNPGGPSQSYMLNHAQNLVALLTLYRQSSDFKFGGDNNPAKSGKHRPILWVAHSLGGILIKAALNYSEGITHFNLNDQRGVYVSTYGIIFLGTPHVGSDLADWALLVQRIVDAVVPKKMINTEGVLLKTLRGHSETIVSINHQFAQIRDRFKIHYAYETLKTSLNGIKTMVVGPPESVEPLPGAVCYGIDATHSNMCRFESSEDPGYVSISEGLEAWVLKAPQIIQKRWEVENEERWHQLCNQVTELLLEHQPSDSNSRPEGLMFSEGPSSPSIHVESCRSSSAGDIHPQPPSIDEASSAGSSARWIASSLARLAPPSPIPSSRRHLLTGMMGKITDRLRRRSDTGCQPSALHREWTRMESSSETRLSEDIEGMGTPNTDVAGISASRSCASSPGVPAAGPSPPPASEALPEPHLPSVPVDHPQLSSPRMSSQNAESDP